MKRYIKASSNQNDIGKEVIINSPGHQLDGEWGIIRMIDDDGFYYVSPWNGEESMVFDRSELRIKRTKSR